MTARAQMLETRVARCPRWRDSRSVGPKAAVSLAGRSPEEPRAQLGHLEQGGAGKGEGGAAEPCPVFLTGPRCHCSHRECKRPGKVSMAAGELPQAGVGVGVEVGGCAEP